MMISVILPTKDRKEVFERTLASLLSAIEGLNAEVIVINDSKNELKAGNDRVTIFQNPSSGAAAARNFGVSVAKGELLLFLDNDVLVTRQNIERIIQLHLQHPKAAFNFYWIYPPDLFEKLPHTKFGRFMIRNRQYDNSSRLRAEDMEATADLFHVSGIASYFFSIMKKDFLLTGGYDERIPKAGVEDIILSKKMKELGIEMFLSKKDIVFHNEADRTTLKMAMTIYERGAMTRKFAVQAGHPEVGIALTPFKRNVYAFLLPVKGLFVFIAACCPNFRIFDPLYFRCCNVLLGLSTYKGFYR